jgi:hypothetical protein
VEHINERNDLSGGAGEGMEQVIAEMRQAWRDTGACVQFNRAPRGIGARCVACNRPELDHQPLQWADALQALLTLAQESQKALRQENADLLGIIAGLRDVIAGRVRSLESIDAELKERR